MYSLIEPFLILRLWTGRHLSGDSGVAWDSNLSSTINQSIKDMDRCNQSYLGRHFISNLLITLHTQFVSSIGEKMIKKFSLHERKKGFIINTSIVPDNLFNSPCSAKSVLTEPRIFSKYFHGFSTPYQKGSSCSIHTPYQKGCTQSFVKKNSVSSVELAT